MVLLPSIDASLLSVTVGMGQSSAKRQPKVRGRKQIRHLWQCDVKRWLESRDKVFDWGLSESSEQELLVWFNALDVDGSGSVESDEIRALMDAMGVEVAEGSIMRMFASIGRTIDAKLNKADFVKLMTLHGAEICGGKLGKQHAGVRGGLAEDANTRLMFLAYRRQRILDDVRDPTKRLRFVDEQAFSRAYGGQALPSLPDRAAASLRSQGRPSAAQQQSLQPPPPPPPLPTSPAIAHIVRELAPELNEHAIGVPLAS